MTLVVTYEVPNDSRNPDLAGYHYDPRVFDLNRNEVSTCLVFIPRLELIYAENEKLYCTFAGGSELKGRMIVDGQQQAIGPNRVVYRLEASSFALEKFMLLKRVSIRFVSSNYNKLYVIIHLATTYYGRVNRSSSSLWQTAW